MKLVERQNHDILFTILAILIFLAFLIFTISGQDGLIRLLRLKQARDSFIVKNRQLLTENLSLRQEQMGFYNLKAIEHTARESLGFVYPDEVIYITQNPR